MTCESTRNIGNTAYLEGGKASSHRHQSRVSRNDSSYTRRNGDRIHYSLFWLNIYIFIYMVFMGLLQLINSLNKIPISILF